MWWLTTRYEMGLNVTKRSHQHTTFQAKADVLAHKPSWQEFFSRSTPKTRRPTCTIPPPPHLHLLSRLPECAQWILCQHLCEVWNFGELHEDYTDTCISLLYQKGNPMDAGNCRPIVVSSCMYQVICKLRLLSLKAPLMCLLPTKQEDVRGTRRSPKPSLCRPK